MNPHTYTCDVNIRHCREKKNMQLKRNICRSQVYMRPESEKSVCANVHTSVMRTKCCIFTHKSSQPYLQNSPVHPHSCMSGAYLIRKNSDEIKQEPLATWLPLKVFHFLSEDECESI